MSQEHSQSNPARAWDVSAADLLAPRRAPQPERLDLATAQARLEGAQGKEYWRSLEDLATAPGFRDMVEREFPQQALGWDQDENPDEGRRNFLKLMGASLALAGLT